MTELDWQATPSAPLRIDGVALDYTALGPPPHEAPTLVLLHEGLGSAGLWRDFPARLAQATGCGVFAYSRRGHGYSDPCPLPRPLDFMTREATDVLQKVLDAIGVKTCILLGHSDGATISTIYAGSHQDHRVRGLILMAPHFFVEDICTAAITEARAAFRTGDLADRMAQHHKDAANTFEGWAGVWLDPGFADWDVTEVIDYLRIPVLAIQGRDDQYGTLAQIDVIAERSYAPVDLLPLDACRHAPHRDAPEPVMDAVTEFVTRLRRIEAEASTAA